MLLSAIQSHDAALDKIKYTGSEFVHGFMFFEILA